MKKYYKFLAVVAPTILPVAAVIGCGNHKEKEIIKKDPNTKPENKDEVTKDPNTKPENKDHLKEWKEKLLISFINDILSKKFISNLKNHQNLLPSMVIAEIDDKEKDTNKIFEKIGINIDKRIVNYIHVDKIFFDDEEGQIRIKISFQQTQISTKEIIIDGFYSKKEQNRENLSAVLKVYNHFLTNKEQNAEFSTNTYEFFKEKFDNKQYIDKHEMTFADKNEIIYFSNKNNISLTFKVKDIDIEHSKDSESSSKHKTWVLVKVTIKKNQSIKEVNFKINNLALQSQRDIDVVSFLFKDKINIEYISHIVAPTEKYYTLKHKEILPSDFINMKSKEISKKSKNFMEHEIESLEIPEFWHDMFDYAPFEVFNMHIQAKGDAWLTRELKEFIIDKRGKIILKNFKSDDKNGQITFDVSITKKNAIGNFWINKKVTVEGFKKAP